MNRFIRQDSSLEQTIKAVVRNNFPAVDISGLSGFTLESFAKNSPNALTGGIDVGEIVESSIDGTASRKLMIWTNSRWGSSTVVG